MQDQLITRNSKCQSSTQIQIEEPVVNDKTQVLSRCESDTQLQQQFETNNQKKSSIKVVQQRIKIRLGVCAMKKKVQSKPMKQILARIKCPQIEIVLMWDCLELPSYQWPKVDALICFYSQGFPYLKAWRYVKQNKPFLFNDLQKQQLLWDRTVVYDILKRQHINVAKHYFVMKDPKFIDIMQEQNWGPDDPIKQVRQNSRAGDKQKNYLQIVPSISSKKSSFQNGNSSNNNNSNSNNISNNSDNNKNKNMIQKISSEKSQYGGDDEEIRGKTKSIFEADQSNNAHQRAKSIKKSKSLEKLGILVEEEKVKPKDNSRKKSQLTLQQKMQKQVKKKKNTSQSYPNTLRKFLQEVRLKCKQYIIQQIEDNLIIKEKTEEKTIKFKKPFVQKPFSAQDHEIAIYYPEEMGGGRKMLFRKKKNTSSNYDVDINTIRRDSNYIYEQFLPTNAFDIKVYTVGQHYMHAQARKSPTLDGIVQRSTDGKQKRFPIILTPQQKFIAKKIVQAFGQKVCGFDLLRANGKSYVCDVNGWSFVKSNQKYWDDCAIILKREISKKFFPSKLLQDNSKYQRFEKNLMNQFRPNEIKYKQQLRSIVCIFRHGDRSPKLKLKIKTKNSKIIQFFNQERFKGKKQLKLKDSKSLIKVLDIVDEILSQIDDHNCKDYSDYKQMKVVLQSGGGKFQQLNRKLQLKINKQEQIKNQQTGQITTKIKEVNMILKWGGQLTYDGYLNAFEFGKLMRTQRYKGQDLLSLHSSYRHDLKTYSSDEGRCIKTAASLLKGFLNIDGDLPPIITTMVNHTSKAQVLLDCMSGQNHSNLSQKIKGQLSEILNSQAQLFDSVKKHINIQDLSGAMIQVIKSIGVPVKKLQKLNQYICLLATLFEELFRQEERERTSEYSMRSSSAQDKVSDKNQEVVMVYKRWQKLSKDFFQQKTNQFNISKIPQIFDTIRHDKSRNSHLFQKVQFDCSEFYALSKLMAKFVVINQYGISRQQKLSTAKSIITPLMKKVRADLLFWKQKNYEQLYWKYKKQSEIDQWKHVRTRLYCTSASHLYSLRNLLLIGNQGKLLKQSSPQTREKARDIIYLSYLSHIEFRIYESFMTSEDDPKRFRIQIVLSPDYSRKSSLQQVKLGGRGLQISDLEELFECVQNTSMQSSRRPSPEPSVKSQKQ